jgi:hypothetical protein
MPNNFNGKRAVSRLQFVASAQVTDLATDTKLSVRISELGLGGCYLDTLNPFPVGTLVVVKILRDDGSFEAKAKVVYSQPSFGMGVAFTEVTPAQKSQLEKWLAQLTK